MALEETKREKEEALAAKDEEIAEMRQKMDEMANEFGDMLKVCAVTCAMAARAQGRRGATRAGPSSLSTFGVVWARSKPWTG